jgi:phosphoribosylformylglycinamidine synthase
VLFLLDLGRGRNRLGGSALAQVYNQVGETSPDLDDPDLFLRFFGAVQEAVDAGLLSAYHDRSDGGLFATLAEMAFGGRTGLRIELDSEGADPLSALFSEELGAVLQVARRNIAAWERIADRHGLSGVCSRVGSPTVRSGDTPGAEARMEIVFGNEVVLNEKVSALNRMWSELTFRMQELRDNPACAREEYDGLLDEQDPGLNVKLTFDPSAAARVFTRRPRMVVLREQGINGQLEMAAAFDRAGFECVDVHMTDLLQGRATLDGFAGLVACGGFSYGDVLGAGSGWAKSILFNEELKAMFARFFERPETFALGVCNGCQMMAQLKDLIPGAEDWPAFVANRSEQFEARTVTVEILQTPSIFFAGMAGSRLPIPVAHGEGRAGFEEAGSLERLQAGELVSLRYVDNCGRPAERYPFNPNGSPGGITGLTSADGRVTIMMPHPERVFRAVQMSYRPPGMFEGEEGPWLRMFRNAREYAG